MSFTTKKQTPTTKSVNLPVPKTILWQCFPIKSFVEVTHTGYGAHDVEDLNENKFRVEMENPWRKWPDEKPVNDGRLLQVACKDETGYEWTDASTFWRGDLYRATWREEVILPAIAWKYMDTYSQEGD